MHMNKKIKHPCKIGILMRFSQLHTYIHRQHQPTISNINHMHYNGINQHSQIKQKILTNLTNTHTKPLTNSNSQSEIPNTTNNSLTLTKQTNSQYITESNLSTPKSTKLFSKETHSCFSRRLSPLSTWKEP